MPVWSREDPLSDCRVTEGKPTKASRVWHSSGKGIEKPMERRSNNSFGIGRRMVGAGRFERPTPCAQGRRMVSNGAIGFRELLLIATTWESAFAQWANSLVGIDDLRT